MERKKLTLVSAIVQGLPSFEQGAHYRKGSMIEVIRLLEVFQSTSQRLASERSELMWTSLNRSNGPHRLGVFVVPMRRWKREKSVCLGAEKQSGLILL